MEDNQATVQPHSTKKKLTYFLIGLLIGLGLSFAFSFIVLEFEKTSYGDHINFKEYFVPLLMDGFSISSLVFLTFGAFAYISYEAGFFDIFVYAFKKFGSSLWFVRPKEDSNFPKTYYDYKQSKIGQPKPFYQWMLWVGLALLVPAIVFSILYFINPITYY